MTNKPKCYISGKITGATEAELDEFYNVEAALKIAGMIPVNPIRETEISDGLLWNDYMRHDIILLMDCQKIFMLDNWQKSKGAQLEKYIADQLDIEEYKIEDVDNVK